MHSKETAAAMADLVDDILNIEKECDQVLAAARQKAQVVMQEAGQQVGAEREQAAMAFEQKAASLRQRSAEQQKAESDRLAREHAGSLGALERIPQSVLEEQVQKLLHHLIVS